MFNLKFESLLHKQLDINFRGAADMFFVYKVVLLRKYKTKN